MITPFQSLTLGTIPVLAFASHDHDEDGECIYTVTLRYYRWTHVSEYFDFRLIWRPSFDMGWHQFLEEAFKEDRLNDLANEIYDNELCLILDEIDLQGLH